MSGVKRQHSPDAMGAEERAPKSSKPESNSAPAAEVVVPDATHGQIRIEVKLGSTRKAARNDPKPPLSWGDIRRDVEDLLGDPRLDIGIP